jgi:hypothetical protein
MRYLALIYANEEAWSALDGRTRGSVLEDYGAFATRALEAGVMKGGDQLRPTRDATTVRVRDEQMLVLDGPYAEVKEALGGYFLLECDTIDEACEWAAQIPGAKSGAIEVRPVHRDPEEVHL